MRETKPLTEETVGQWLSEDTFSDIYEQVWDSGQRYFTRQGENGNIDLVIAFQDVDDFSESTGVQIMIDFKKYKDKILLVLWTLTDPENPLGFPISFHISNEEDMKQLEQILTQEKVWIHYLTSEEDRFFHVFSEAYEIPESERNTDKIQELLTATPVDEEDVEQPEIEEKDANQLTDKQLTQMGFGYALDYSEMVEKLGEELAQENVMSAVLQAVTMIRNHPQSHIRTSRFLTWVTQQNEKTSKGEDSRLLTIYVSSEHEELYHFWTSAHQEADPFGAVFLAFPEFITTLREQPLKHGGYPILEYEAGVLMSIDLDEKFRKKLASLWEGTGINPYLQEEK